MSASWATHSLAKPQPRRTQASYVGPRGTLREIFPNACLLSVETHLMWSMPLSTALSWSTSSR